MLKQAWWFGLTVVGLFFLGSSAQAASGSFGGGNGSTSTPYLVEDCLDLQAINNSKSSNYRLSADIDCSATTGWNAGAGFAPIGDAGSKFTGVLDGNGKKINSLYINRSGSNYVGIFSWIGSAGRVRNLGVTNVNVSGSNYAGGLVSALEGSVSSTYVTGSVQGSNYAGGLVGYLPGGNVSFSYAAATVSGSANFAGGFVGYVEGGTVSDSYASSTVSSNSPAGFAGINFVGTLENVYAVGPLSGSGKSGITVSNLGTITSSYYDSETTGASDTGKGTPKTTAQMKTQSTFSGWDFTVAGNGTIGEWIMAGYPHLQFEHRTTITSAVELQLMAVNLDGDYTLANNIDAGAITNYTPVGTVAVPFTGTLDGNFYLIKNLTISQSNLQAVGIFGSTSEAASITEVGYYSGSVTGDRFVGALVGYNNAPISKSFANVNVTAVTTTPSSAAAGGLVGANTANLTNSYATGNVTSTHDVGGLIGYNSGVVSSTYAVGRVAGGVNLGGLIGRAEVSAITNSFAAGLVGTGTSRGGLVGSLSGGASISGARWFYTTDQPLNCYSTGNTGCGNIDDDLTFFYNSTNIPMSTWAFSAVWTQNSYAYPTLTGFGDVTAPVIVSISSDKTNGAYKAGEIVDVDITFSEAATSTGSITVTLETGDTDRTCTFTVTGASSATCNYTVQTGDTTNDLTVSAMDGTLNDASSNATVNFSPLTNLAANKALVIDTTAPVITRLGSETINLEWAATYVDDGATATDSQAGNLTSSISTDNPVNTRAAGTYAVRYSVADVAGNSASSTRTVIVANFKGSAAAVVTPSGASGTGSVPLTVLLNNATGTIKTNVATVTLKFNADTQVKSYAVALTPDFGSTILLPYAPTVTYQLPNQAGTYQLYIRLFSTTGHPSETFTRTVIFEPNTSSGPTATTVPVTTPFDAPVFAKFTFTKNLRPGASGPEVRELQRYLNSHGFAVQKTGPGSLGQETLYYGAATRAAVKRFQEAHADKILKPVGLTAGTGLFMNSTRALANAE